MKITFIADGTRDDVEPVVALGQLLQKRGHEVRWSTTAEGLRAGVPSIIVPHFEIELY